MAVATNAMNPLVSQLHADAILDRPKITERSLVKAGFANKTILSAFKKFQHGHLDNATDAENITDDTHQGVTTRGIASIVLNQFVDELKKVSADQWEQMQIEAWQANLLPRAPANMKDMDGIRMTTYWWGDPRMLYAPFGTAPRNIELEMREAMMSSTRVARGFQILLDALFTDAGLELTLDGITHLLYGAHVTEAQMLTTALIGQRFYEEKRLALCANVTQYEKLLNDVDELRFIINKNDYPQQALAKRALEEMAREGLEPPDNAIVTQGTMLFLQHNLRPNMTFNQSGHSVNFGERDQSTGVMKLGTDISTPSITYRVLPGAFVKDDPMLYDITAGSAWNMGSNPNRPVAAGTYDGKFDIEAYEIATDTMQHIEFLKALEACQLFDRNGKIRAISHGQPGYKPESEALDPFQREIGTNGKAFEPIDYIGEYNIRRTELIVRHADSLLQYAAGRIGTTVAGFNKVFSDWFTWVDQMDGVDFDLIDKTVKKVGEPRSAEVYRQPYVDYDLKLEGTGYTGRYPVFASSYPWLVKIAQDQPKRFDEGLVNAARNFLAALRCIVNSIDSIHSCLITDAYLTPPESVDQVSREAAFYSFCMNTLGREHVQIWTTTEKGAYDLEQLRPLVAPLTATSPAVTLNDEVKKEMVNSTKNLDIGRVVIGGIIALKKAKSKLTDEEAVLLSNIGTLAALEAKVTEWINARASDNTKDKYTETLEAAKKVPESGKTGRVESAMTALSIPDSRADQFTKWAKNKEYTIQKRESESVVPGVDLVWPAASAAVKLPQKVGFDHPLGGLQEHNWSKYNELIGEIERLYENPRMKAHMQTAVAICTSVPLCWTAWAVLHSRFVESCIKKSVQNSVMPLINILVAQPNTQIRGSSVVLLKAGSQTGMINISQFDMRFSVGAATKWFLAHLSVKIGIMIKDPRYVWPWLGCQAIGIAFGGRIKKLFGDMFAKDLGEIQNFDVDLAAFPMSIEDWPLARHFSIINYYPELHKHDDNMATTRISTGYRNNQNWNFYKEHRTDYVRPVVSTGMCYYMNDKGVYATKQEGMGVFGKMEHPGLHARIDGIRMIQEVQISD